MLYQVEWIDLKCIFINVNILFCVHHLFVVKSKWHILIWYFAKSVISIFLFLLFIFVNCISFFVFNFLHNAIESFYESQRGVQFSAELNVMLSRIQLNSVQLSRILLNLPHSNCHIDALAVTLMLQIPSFIIKVINYINNYISIL